MAQSNRAISTASPSNPPAPIAEGSGFGKVLAHHSGVDHLLWMDAEYSLHYAELGADHVPVSPILIATKPLNVAPIALPLTNEALLPIWYDS